MTSADILTLSRSQRTALLFSYLLVEKSPLRDFTLNGIIIKTPELNSGVLRDFRKFKVKLPIVYRSTKKYKIKVSDNEIYTLFKIDNCYSLLSTPFPESLTEPTIVDLKASYQWTYLYLLIHRLLDQVVSDGISVKVIDEIWDLSEYYPNEDPQLTVEISWRPKADRPVKDDHLYISIFN